MVLEDPATGEPGTERFPPFSARTLSNAGFKNELLPFSDPYCPTCERTANAFHFLIIEQGSMVGPRPLDTEGVLGVIS